MRRIDVKEYRWEVPMDIVLDAESQKSISPRVLASEEIERGLELELYEMDGEIGARLLVNGEVVLDEENEGDDPLNFMTGDTRYVIHLV